MVALVAVQRASEILAHPLPLQTHGRGGGRDLRLLTGYVGIATLVPALMRVDHSSSSEAWGTPEGCGRGGMQSAWKQRGKDRVWLLLTRTRHSLRTADRKHLPECDLQYELFEGRKRILYHV